MNIKQIAYSTVLAGGFVWAAGSAFGQDATTKPHVPLQKLIGQVTATAPVPSLFVLNSGGAKLEGNKLILTGVSSNTIVFADRPIRAAGHQTTDQFLMQWDEGKDNFALDPPNATVSVLGGDGSQVIDAVVTIKSPKLEGSTLTFDVTVLEGNLDGANGPAALFIDDRGGGGGGGDRGGGGFGDRDGGNMGDDRAGGYWYAPVYHGAWYAGQGNRDPDRCGYLPYPPCRYQ
jgi:hypothetical protein